MSPEKLFLKRMGVINVTPNSFSDGGENLTSIQIREKIKSFGPVHALDIGAESTAPMNSPVTWEEEWERLQVVLPLLLDVRSTISLDTYHPETIFHLVKFWKDQKMVQDLFWNDVSGKFDEGVRDFLREGKRFQYVLCHNRAPKRELAGKHMEYVMDDGRIEEELLDFFGPHRNPRVIFDPCVGFSKTYDENWFILEHFGKFQKLVKHDRWLIGFSRKSFLKKKFQTEERAELDKIHGEVLRTVLEKAAGEVWVRTHRPELLTA